MNIALIGLGMVADTHLAAIRDGTDLRLAGVLARDRGRSTVFARKAAEQLGYEVAVFDDVNDIARDPAVDFVLLTTPPDARLAFVETLAQAGKPILMEKPIERDLAAARHIVALCEAARVPLGVMLQHRARATSRKLKAMIEEGALGEITTLEIRVPWWREQSYYDAPGRGTYARDGGGVMLTQAIHTLDLALWLLGPIHSLQAMMRRTPLHRLEAEDWAGALFDMECGAIGSMTATTSAYPGGPESLTLQGTKAAVHLASNVLTVSHLDGRHETHGAASKTGGGADPMAFSHAWHQTVIEDFASGLATGAEPLATGQSALAVHAVIDAMERASRSGTSERVVKT